MIPVTVSMPEKVIELIDEFVKIHHISRSSFIRLGLERYLEFRQELEANEMEVF